MQGPGGNVSRGLPGGPASTVASGAGRCESGALMHSFGIFLQGLLGVVAFSTLMRDPLQCGAWVGQCALYIVIMIFEKSVVFIVLLILQWKKVALLNPIENPDLKLAIVMLIVPFFVNAFMFWVVDNFLMRKGKTKAKLEERGANQDSRNGSKVRYRRAASHEESESEILISADDEMEESDAEEDLRRPVKKKHRFGLPV
ncbi:store-operated calcium entry regulator STIMATE isoform X2 [Rattus norvegicus]|uniref:store-operated calcium entry regulator STIMATE isoform X2 n=1 Tax=Rattus norvegicus TaxID=10116 RepID=UPI002FD7ACB9